jgi:CheY-like chemotaxis protein
VRLLVVDDDRVFREELATLLSDEGHAARAAPSAAKALEALEEEEFDAIFSDVRMPRMDGLELLRTVRERWPRVDIVMITGYATVEAAVEAMKLGALDYVRKPFRSEEIGRILAMIEERRAYSSDGRTRTEPSRLAAKWAKERYEVLLVGGPTAPLTDGITRVDLPTGGSSVGLKEAVLGFVETHPRPAVVVAGIERLLALHRAEEVAREVGEIIERVEPKGPIAVGFDPSQVTKTGLVALQGVIASARAHGTLGALVNPLRRAVLRRLAEGATSFTELMHAAGIDDSPKLSFHLRTLQDDGLVTHLEERYRLTPRGEDAVRILEEVDRLGSTGRVGERVSLFATAAALEEPPSPRGRARREGT